NSEILKLNRAKYEERFLIKNAKKLSSSIFDLIKENQYKPHLIKLINQSVRNTLIKWGSILFAVFVTIFTISGGLSETLGYLGLKKNKTNNTEIKKTELDSLKLLNKELQDSITSLNQID